MKFRIGDNVKVIRDDCNVFGDIATKKGTIGVICEILKNFRLYGECCRLKDRGAVVELRNLKLLKRGRKMDLKGIQDQIDKLQSKVDELKKEIDEKKEIPFVVGGVYEKDNGDIVYLTKNRPDYIITNLHTDFSLWYSDKQWGKEKIHGHMKNFWGYRKYLGKFTDVYKLK